MGTVASIEAKGKSNQNNFARIIRITNLSRNDLKRLVLKIKSSTRFLDAVLVDLDVKAGSFKDVDLPHIIQPGHELEEKDDVEYVLMQDKRELCTTTATVWLNDHSLFVVAAEKGEPQDFTKGISRRFKIRNESSVTLPGAILSISGTTCFSPARTVVEELKPGESTTVTLQQSTQDGIDLETIEEFTSYSLQYNKVVLTQFKRRARMYEYSKYFEKFMPSVGFPPLRVILAGKGGAGKSSMVDSLFTAFSPEDKVVRGVAAISPLTEHGSSEFLFYVLLPYLHLADPWGHQPLNYVKGEFLKMLDGIMQVGSNMNNPVEEKEEKNKIHSVVLVVPAGSSGFDCEKEIVRQALQRRLNATIVMARCDDILDEGETAQFRLNPNKLVPALEARRDIIKKTVGTGAVIQGAPYVADENSKIFERDRLTMRILEFALDSGLNFQRTHTTPQNLV